MTLEAIFAINNDLLLGTVYLEVNRCPHDIRAMLYQMPKSKGGKQGGNFLCSPGYSGLTLSNSNNITQNLADIDAPETLTRAPVPKKPAG